MPEHPLPPLQHPTDTAHWTLFYRATETVAAPTTSDTYSQALLSLKGKNFISHFPKAKVHPWSILTRIRSLDEGILNATQNLGVDLVLNLGCGFDTRPYRLPLPSQLRWIDVDFPCLIEEKRSVLAEFPAQCQIEFVGLDLTQKEKRHHFLNRLTQSASKILVLSEGFLVYLPLEEVTSLAKALTIHPHFRYWMLDCPSPLGLKVANRRWANSLAKTGSRLQFAPSNRQTFFQKLGWNTKKQSNIIQEAKRFHLTPTPRWYWRTAAWLLPPSFYLRLSEQNNLLFLERAELK